MTGISSAAGGQMGGDGGHCEPDGDGCCCCGGCCCCCGCCCCGGCADDGPAAPILDEPPGRFVVYTVGIVKLPIDDVGFTINGNGAIGNGKGAANGSV